MKFSRQEYWSGLLFPSPGDLPYAGIEPRSPALAGGFFSAEPWGKSLGNKCYSKKKKKKNQTGQWTSCARNGSKLWFSDGINQSRPHCEGSTGVKTRREAVGHVEMWTGDSGRRNIQGQGQRI